MYSFGEMLEDNKEKVYISSLEEKRQERKINSKKMKQKYERIRNYAYIATLIILIETIILFV